MGKKNSLKRSGVMASFFKRWTSGDEESEVFKRYTIDWKKKLGEGGYGAAYLAIDNETQEKLAVKVIDTKKQSLAKIEKECAMMSIVKHENVIQIRAKSLGPRNQNHLYFIFLEMANGGELFDQVIDRGQNAMKEDEARVFMEGLLAGVQACHDVGIAHRDLKLENALLTQQGVVKIIDFGLSHRYPMAADGTYDRSQLLREKCGSKSYAAPEVMSGRGYDGYVADMWSLGVCLFAMLSGFFPLDEATDKDWRFSRLTAAQIHKQSTTKAIYSWYKRECHHLSRSIIDLLDSMLQVDPSARATMQDVLQHPWITNKMETAPLVLGMKENYDAQQFVADSDGPVWRSVMAVGPSVSVDDMMEGEEEVMPVYRSLSIENADDVPMPVLARQVAASVLG